jgi:thiamine-monophosphate kinase
MSILLGDLGEDALVARLLEVAGGGGRLLVGPGDDCAVVERGPGALGLLKTDAIVEGVHFEKSAPAQAIGWKAVARVFSDIAAMGGRPCEVLVTAALRRDEQLRRVEGIYRGIRRCLERFGASLAGGETVSVPQGAPMMLSVAATGTVARRALVLRSGGRPGDVLAVTGRLGGSIGGHHLKFVPRVEEAGWLASRFRLRAMMDLSDGLAADLPRLARASGCGFELDRAAVPRRRGCTVKQALGDGEDYELLVALPARSWDRVGAAWRERFPMVPLTGIGRLVEGQVGGAEGGWDHFGDERRAEIE